MICGVSSSQLPPKKGGNAILFQVTTIPNTTALLKIMPSASNNDHVFQNQVIYFHDSMDWFTGNLNRKPSFSQPFCFLGFLQDFL
jgi:hypothetical protein